jgi:hypothetical protein
MGIGGESLGYLFVAGGAGLAAHKIPWRGILDLSSSRFGARLGLGRLSPQGSDTEYASAQNHQTSSQSQPLARSRTHLQSRYRPIFMHEKYRLM